MYLEAMRPELQEFYSGFKDEKSLFKELNNEQLTVCRKYFTQITKYKAESIEGKPLALNGYEYVSAICNLNETIKCINKQKETESSYVGYIVKKLSTNEELRVTSDMLDTLMSGRNMMIKSIADSTLIELKYITYISTIGSTDDYIRDKTRRLALALDDKTITDRFIGMYKDFYMAYLPLPQYLVDRFNQKVDVQYQKNTFERCTKAFTKDISSVTLYNNAITDYGRMIIVNSHDHLEQLRYAELIVNYSKAYIKISRHEKIDLMLFVKAGMQRVYYVHAANGDRLATKNEQKLLVSACFKKDIYFIPEDKLNLIKVFVWAHTGKFELLRSAGYPVNDYLGRKVEARECYKILFDSAILEALEQSIKYLTSNEFLQNDVNDLAKGLKPIQYLESAEDEIKDLGLKVKLEKVKKECANSTNSYYKMAYDIAFKALKFNDMVLSVKQMNVINKMYETLVSDKDNSNNKFSDELMEMINAITEYNRYKRGTFMYKLIDGIVSHKRCSEKQYNIIEVEYDKIKSVLDEAVDEIGGDINTGEPQDIDVEVDMDDMFLLEPAKSNNTYGKQKPLPSLSDDDIFL